MEFASIHLLAFNLLQSCSTVATFTSNFYHIYFKFISNSLRIHFKFVSHLLQICLITGFKFQRQLFAGVLQNRCFFKKTFQNWDKKTVPGLFLSKVTGLQPAMLLNKRLHHRCLSLNFAKSLIFFKFQKQLFADALWNWCSEKTCKI